MLYVKRSGTRSWVQRLTIHGERIDIGHGSADPDTAESVSLARARKVASTTERSPVATNSLAPVAGRPAIA